MSPRVAEGERFCINSAVGLCNARENSENEFSMTSIIPFNRPFIIGKELDYIVQTVTNGHLSGDGEYTKKCNGWLEKHLNIQKALLAHSCTGALEMAAILCDIKQGDEIIMPSFTFVSTANAFVLRGGVPVFVDIRPDTLNIDADRIEAAITDRTRAIACVHYAGAACQMDALLDICERHKLWLVEDAAQALLSTWEGKPLGSIGHLGCLSFHETKNIISGEGGALLINDQRLLERAEIIREKGTNRTQFFRGQIDKYTWVDIGSSFLPSELTSAFLYAQLECAESIIAKRKSLCRAYHESLQVLEEKDLLRLPSPIHAGGANGHLFYILTASLEERTGLIEHLALHKIMAVFHYVPLHSSPAGKRFGRVSGSMDITSAMSDRLLRLPLYYEMSEKDVHRVAACIKEFYC